MAIEDIEPGSELQYNYGIQKIEENARKLQMNKSTQTGIADKQKSTQTELASCNENSTQTLLQKNVFPDSNNTTEDIVTFVINNNVSTPDEPSMMDEPDISMKYLTENQTVTNCEQILTQGDKSTFETKDGSSGTPAMTTDMETPTKHIIIELDSTASITKLVADDMGQLSGEDHTPSSSIFASSPVLDNSNVQRELFPTNNSNIAAKKVKKRPAPLRPCPFCFKFKTQLSRHIKTVHKAEPQVQKLLFLTPSKQLLELGKLRRKGILLHNQKIAASGSTKFELAKRGRSCALNVYRCKGCDAFLRRRWFSQHKCISKDKCKNVCSSYQATNEKGEEFAEMVLPFFGEKHQNILKDDIILSLGLHNYVQKGNDEKYPEYRKRTMNYMRTLSNLSSSFQEECLKNGKKVVTKDIFNRCNVSELQTVIDKLSIKDGKIQHGQKLNLGIAVRNAAGVVRSKFLQNNLDEDAKEVKKFLAVFKLNWQSNFRISEKAVKKRSVTHSRRPANSVNSTDRMILKKFVIREIKNIITKNVKTPTDYFKLRRLAISRLILLCGRRVDEPSRLTYKQLEEAYKDVYLKSSDNVKKYHICYVDAKNAADPVPLLIPKSPYFKRTLDYLSDPEARKKVKIAEENKFIFASGNASVFHVSGYVLLLSMLFVICSAYYLC